MKEEVKHKPWLEFEGGASLEAFLGSRGYRTSGLKTTKELIDKAAQVFELPPLASCLAMSKAIRGLSQKTRSRLARMNLNKPVTKVYAAWPMATVTEGDAMMERRATVDWLQTRRAYFDSKHDKATADEIDYTIATISNGRHRR